MSIRQINNSTYVRYHVNYTCIPIFNQSSKHFSNTGPRRGQYANLTSVIFKPHFMQMYEMRGKAYSSKQVIKQEQYSMNFFRLNQI